MPGAPRCQHVSEGDRRCGTYALKGEPYCRWHQPQPAEEETMEEDVSPAPEARRPADEVSAENAAFAAALAAEGLMEPLAVEEGVREQMEARQRPSDEERPRGEIVPPQGPQHIEGQALRASLELLAEERAMAKINQEARAKARRMGKKLPPVDSRLFVANAPDVIAITDSNGKSLVKPGWIGRWVRLTDSQGRKSDVRLREFKAWGAEVIMDPEESQRTGKQVPKTDVWGIAVQYPAERYGARVIRHSPRAAFDSDVILSNLDDLAESINSESGYRAVQVSATKDHGNRSL